MEPGYRTRSNENKGDGLPEISKTIKAGERLSIESPVDSSNVSMTYTGDRRLVVLETAFRKQ